MALSEKEELELLELEELEQKAVPAPESRLDQGFDALESVGGTLLKPAAWALEKAAPVFETVNKYGANPIRKGILSLQEGKGLVGAGEDAINQFGSDDAPATGKDIAKKAGITDKSLSEYFPDAFNETGKGFRLQKGGLLDVSPAGVAGGAAVDTLTDPLTYVGAGLLKKAGPVVEAGGKVAGEAALEAGAGLLNKTKGLIEESPLVGRVREKMSKINAPDVMDTVKKRVAQTEAKAGELTLPEYKKIEALEKRLPDLENKLLPGQKEMYRSGESRDLIKTYREMPGENPEALRKYELAQKQEGINKLNETIKSVSPDIDYDLTSRGDKLVSHLNDVYDKNKELAGAFFNDLDEIPVPPIEGGNNLAEKISNKLGLDKYLETTALDDAPDALQVKKLGAYGREMGISPRVHQITNEIIDTVNNKELTIRQLRAIRESLRNEITQGMSQSEKAQIGKIRAAMLDHIEDIASDKMPNSRGIFKEYAKNESAADQLEKVLGGALDDPFSITKNMKPEKVMDKLFSNTNNVKLAKDFLGDNFNTFKANYLQTLIDRASPNGVLSGQKLKTLLEKNGPALKEAFGKDYAKLQRIHDLSDFIRLVPDAPTINPSGTAKSMNAIGLLKSAGAAAKEPWKIPGKLMEKGSEIVERRAVTKQAEGLLGGKK